MQTIWSRIAQVRGAGSACRCPQCLSSVSGMTRRAGTIATRSGPKYLTSSTFVYSGIFAAAATFDAGMKQQRREKWDRAIAEVRYGLGQEQDAMEEMPVNQPMEVEDALSQVVEERLAATVNMDLPATEGVEHDPFSVVEPTYRRPHWPTNTGPQLQTHSLAPESIFANGKRRALNDVRSWSAKKIELIGLSIDTIQREVFLALNENGMAEEAANSVPTEYGDLILQEPAEITKSIKVLNNEYHLVTKFEDSLLCYEPSPDRESLRLNKFTPTNRERTDCNAPNELNILLQRLFKKHRKRIISTPSLLAELCYTLSWTSLPPSLDTFNTLLLGMQHVDEPKITYKILDSLRNCNLRPNEVTVSAALCHYTKSNDAQAFLNYVETMRGKHGGLALARPDVLIGKACQGRLIRSEKRPDKVIQLPYPTPMVFSALIEGVIKFGGFDTALDVCKNMGEQGWGLCMSGLAPLLYDCAERKDWHSGVAVWQQIKQLETRSRRQAHHDRQHMERIPMGVFASMLRLCLGKGDRVVYDDVWRHATIISRHKPGLLISKVTRQVPGAEPVARPVAAETEFNSKTVYKSVDLEVGAGIETAGKSPDSTPIQALEDEITADTYEYRPTRVRSDEGVSMEQLHGNMPGGQDLDDYEIAERPMQMHA